MNIDLSDIKSFITVADLKSMTAAALQLNYLQSNITAKIKKIENHYKRQMFIRQPKGVELTESGHHLYQQYKKMLLTWEETDFKMLQQDETLRFGTNTSLGGMHFYSSFQQLYCRYPELAMTMKTGETAFIEDEVLQGRLDIAYVLGHPHSSKLKYIHKADEQLMLIGKNTIKHDNLADCLNHQNILLSSEKCSYAISLDQLYHDYRLNKGESIHIYDRDAMLLFTQLGMGISLTTQSMIEKMQLQYYREIPKQYRMIGLYLIMRNDHVLSAIEKQFIALNERL